MNHFVDQKFKEHMVNMLTLRYDPMEKPTIPHLKYTAWAPTIYETTALSLEEKLIKSILKLAPYKHIGIGLSSGIDSVLLLCMIRRLFPKKRITAIHYVGQNDEQEDAKAYADMFGANFVSIYKKTILDTIDWQVTIMKDMVWDGFDYMLFQTAKKLGCDILVDGTGADELFGGYTFRYFNYNPTGNSVEARVYGYLDVHKRDWVEDQAQMFGPDVNFTWEMVTEHLKPYFANKLPELSQIFHADWNGKLAHLFTKKQRVFGKLYEIATYSPYLDKDVVEYATHLDSTLKFAGTVGKTPLRQIAARMDLAVTVKKFGFSHDTVKDWNSPENWATAHNDLTDPDNQMFAKGLISYDWVKRHATSNKSRYDVRYVNKFMQLMALEDYLRKLEFQ